jgi:signal transduction histidine kinase
MPSIVRKWMQTQLFEQAPFCICVVNRAYHVIAANPQFTRTYGPWKGRRCYSVYKRRRSRCERCGVAETFRDGKVRVREEEGVDLEGRPRHYMVHIIPLVAARGKISSAVEISTDITAMKNLEQEKLKSERLAVVGQTVAGLAHGIKNIIMGLDGGMYVMGSGIRRNDDQRVKQGWAMLEENVNRISHFAHEFLGFARGSKPHVSQVDPNAVAAKVIELFAEKARMAHIELCLEPQAGLAPAPMDEAGIHNCLSNLISNALDACESSDKPEPRVTLSTQETDGVISFQVADNAGGIDTEMRQKVFTNFFSTKATGRGTGLGLLTTRRIVQDHGGSVSFDSTENVGSVFRLEFPRNRLPRPGEEEKAARPGAPQGAPAIQDRRDSHGAATGQADSDCGGRTGCADLPANRTRGRGLQGDHRRRR